jgi:drug/metabolite transporter (DMT)-like permease
MLRLVLCVSGVWIAWSAHDYLQEKIFKIPGFRFGVFMAFSLQSMSFLLSFLYRISEWALAPRGHTEVIERERLAEEEQQQRTKEQAQGLLLEASELGSPSATDEAATPKTLGLYLVLSLLIAAANAFATVSLNYVTMQTKVLFKSSKIVTVMLLGTLMFGRVYHSAEYVSMLLVVLGLAGFTLASSSTDSTNSPLFGIALLACAILVDSIVPNVQNVLLRTRPKQELVFHTNWVSAVLTLGYLVVTGELRVALRYLGHRPHVLALLLLQSACGYLGILAYLETVGSFGPKVTTLVTSCRKLFTIVLSSLAFGHELTGFHVASVLSVFFGVVLNAHRERACSRSLAAAALLVMLAIVSLELQLDIVGRVTNAIGAVTGLFGVPVKPISNPACAGPRMATGQCNLLEPPGGRLARHVYYLREALMQRVLR